MPLCLNGDKGFEPRRRSLVWQAIKPDRHPHAIWTVQSDSDIVEALYYARSEGRRVSIVSGGHSYIGHGVQDGTVLLDLSRLTSATVDPAGRVGSLQPGVRVAAFDAELERADLAFPIGHELEVGVVGFLLGGGLGWNPDHWGGMACRNVTAAEIVLASGERVIADAEHHADLFWAVRGAGPCFPGVVTRLHVQLFPRPAAIRKSVHAFPNTAVDHVTAWIAGFRDEIDDRIELSLTLAAGESQCIVTAIVFADTDLEAIRLVDPIRRSIPAGHIVSKEEHLPQTFATLLRDAKGDAALRHAVESAWSDNLEASAHEAARALRSAPSPLSLIDIAVRRRAVQTGELAGSVAGSAFLFIDAAWHADQDDARNQSWMDDLLAGLAPCEKGALINETDWNQRPDRLARCYAPEALARLTEVVRRYDPTGLFINPLDRMMR
jgi:FAD/FMN-containing dehydrogenase